MDFAIVLATVPQHCFKSYSEWGKELDISEKDKSFKCKTINGTSNDFAKIEAIIAAKNKPTVDICGELNITRKSEKKPQYPHELTLELDHKRHGNRNTRRETV